MAAHKKLTRRGFLKATTAGAAAMAATSTVGTAAAAVARQALANGPHPGDPGAGPQRWVMVIDLARCDGCGECAEACSAMHLVPPGQEWIHVYKIRQEGLADPLSPTPPTTAVGAARSAVF
jgi:ferredoxin